VVSAGRLWLGRFLTFTDGARAAVPILGRGLPRSAPYRRVTYNRVVRIRAAMLNEQIARSVGPSKIDIGFERRGTPTDPALLLVMGLGAQLCIGLMDFTIHW
jgi:hypothetical protein